MFWRNSFAISHRSNVISKLSSYWARDLKTQSSWGRISHNSQQHHVYWGKHSQHSIKLLLPLKFKYALQEPFEKSVLLFFHSLPLFALLQATIDVFASNKLYFQFRTASYYRNFEGCIIEKYLVTFTNVSDPLFLWSLSSKTSSDWLRSLSLISFMTPLSDLETALDLPLEATEKERKNRLREREKERER